MVFAEYHWARNNASYTGDAVNLDTTTYRKDTRYPVVVGKRARGYGHVSRSGVWVDAGLRVNSPRGILIHTTNGVGIDYRSEATFLCDSWDVSCHYVVSAYDDTVLQILDDMMVAWHSGDCLDLDLENDRSIGIEIAWTPSRGPLPEQAKTNTANLVRLLLPRFRSITKIDTHRRQAVPAGRKTDPAGWSDADFDMWRAQILGHSTAPDPWTQWGSAFPLDPAARGFGIPSAWLPERGWLKEARSTEQRFGPMALTVFQGGEVLFDTRNGVPQLVKFAKELP